MTDIENQDWWNLDVSLCLYLGNNLLRLSRGSHGYPAGPGWTPENWREALETHSSALLRYAALKFEDESEELLDEAKTSLRWVTDNLELLWD